MGTLALIGLGSNLGDRQARLDGAVAALGECPENTVHAVSSYHETAPVGGPGGQGAFLNAAAAVETMLDPEALLRTLHAIEGRAGRVRAQRWGERTLDLDLLLHGDTVSDAPALRIPHPRMAVRRFVLAPLAEVAPGAVDPLTGRTVAELLANLDRRPSYVALRIFGPKTQTRVFQRVVSRLAAVGLSHDFRERRVKPPPLTQFFKVPDWWLDHMAQELSADRWLVELEGDRWIVSDYWFDGVFELGRQRYRSDAEWRAFKERFSAIRSRIIAPTFLAVDALAEEEIRTFVAKDSGEDHPALGLPLLRLEGKDEVSMAEQIVVACNATRTG